MKSELINPHAAAWQAFTENASEHELNILRDDGVYRHVRMNKPGTRMWGWDITTWPGHLATSGDIADGFMFTRTHDMFGFFNVPEHKIAYYSDGAPSIDLRYWAQKLCGGRSLEVKIHHAATFLQHVREHLDEHPDFGEDAQTDYLKQLELLRRLHALRKLDQETIDQLFTEHWQTMTLRDSIYGIGRFQDQRRETAQNALGNLWSTQGLTTSQVEELEAGEDMDWFNTPIAETSPEDRRLEILAEAETNADSGEEAHLWLSNNSEVFGDDTWEWDFTEYEFGFALACYAINATVQAYLTYRDEVPAPDNYLVVDGEELLNTPDLPTFDMSILNAMHPEATEASMALDLYTRILRNDRARTNMAIDLSEIEEFITSYGDTMTIDKLKTIKEASN